MIFEIIVYLINFQNDLNITKVTIISKNKEIIKANELEIFIIQLFYNSVNEGLLKINDYFLYLKSAKSNYKVNKDVIKINLHLQMLSYDDLGASSKNAEKNKITAYLEEELTLIVKNTFTSFQKQGIDSFGIYKYLQRFRTHFYKEIEDNYNEYF